MFGKLFSSHTFTDPGRLDAAMLAVTSAVRIDDSLGNGDLLALAYSLRDVTPDDVEFFTAPVLGTGMEGRRAWSTSTTSRASACGPTCAATRSPRTPASSASRRCPTSPADAEARQPRVGPSVAGRPGSCSGRSRVCASADRRSGQVAGSTRRGATPARTARRNATPASASPDSFRKVAVTAQVPAPPAEPATAAETADRPTEAPT